MVVYVIPIKHEIINKPYLNRLPNTKQKEKPNSSRLAKDPPAKAVG